nr:hypothetical protein [Tanacetum cinerariifolium]
ANVSKSISIWNEDLSNDTTPSVARKFLNEVKSTIVTLQRVVKQRMTIETHNWASSAHQEFHKINKILELEIVRLLKAIVSKDIISVVQNASVVDTSDLQTELEHELKAERLAKIQDPLALMANSNNPYTFSAPHQDLSPFNQNYMQQPMLNPEDITNSTTAMNMALALMAKAFKLNYSTPTNNNQRISSNPRNRQIAQPGMNMGQDRQMQMVGGNGGNQFRQYAGQNAGNLHGLGSMQGIRMGTMQYRMLGIRLLRIQEFRMLEIRMGQLVFKEMEIRIRLQMAKEKGCCLSSDTAVDCSEGRGRNPTSSIRQASSSGTQTDSTPVYDTDGSAEVHENYNDNEIFNMFTQEEQYTKLLEPIPEPQQVPQNDNNVISEITNVEQGWEAVEQHSANFEETRTLYESLYQNLAVEVEKVNSVNRKLKETNADLTTELARYKNQERCFEISQEKYDKLERCYQQSVYQEQCLSKKINALHLSTGKK